MGRPGPILMMRRKVTIRIRSDQDGETGATAEGLVEAVIHEEPEHPAAGAAAVPGRVAAKRLNFYHSNPRKLLNSRRNFLKPSWFPSSFWPLGFRARSALTGGEGAVNGAQNPGEGGAALHPDPPLGRAHSPGTVGDRGRAGAGRSGGDGPGVGEPGRDAVPAGPAARTGKRFVDSMLNRGYNLTYDPGRSRPRDDGVPRSARLA